MEEIESIVLLYNIEREKEKQIRALCRALDIAVKKVKTDQVNESIGSLCGRPIVADHKADVSCEEEMMIFSGFSGMKLDVFLAGYKQHEIEPIELKAVTTEKNITWTVGYIYEELKKERESFK